MVLSHSGWQRLFAGDPAIVGRPIQIRGVTVEVVGVAAKSFVGLNIVPPDFWAPLTLSSLVEDGPSLFGPQQPQRLDVVGRLRPEVAVESAKAALTIWTRQITVETPAEGRDTTAILLPAATPVPLSFGGAVLPRRRAFGLVPLTAAANMPGRVARHGATEGHRHSASLGDAHADPQAISHRAMC